MIGVATTLLLAGGLKGIIAPLLVGKYEEMPAAARAPIFRVLLIVFPIELGIVGFLLFARGASSDRIDLAFALSAALLSLITPVLAAGVFALSELWGWSSLHVARWERLTRLERKLDQLRNFCLTHLAELENPDPRKSAPSSTTPLQKAS